MSSTVPHTIWGIYCTVLLFALEIQLRLESFDDSDIKSLPVLNDLKSFRML